MKCFLSNINKEKNITFKSVSKGVFTGTPSNYGEIHSYWTDLFWIINGLELSFIATSLKNKMMNMHYTDGKLWPNDSYVRDVRHLRVNFL